MSQSVIDCCNSALSMVGAASIMSLTDNSREARVCNLQYDSNRRDELRKHYWNFAIKRAALAPDTATPAFDFAYQFTLPADCLRIVIPNDANLDWTLEGRKILTNSIKSPFSSNVVNSQPGTVYTPPGGVGTTYTAVPPAPQLNLRYVSDVTDCTQWDASFYAVVSIAIAIDICEPLTQSNQKKQMLLQQYKDAISEARIADAFENLPADAPDDSWWLVRY